MEKQLIRRHHDEPHTCGRCQHFGEDLHSFDVSAHTPHGFFALCSHEKNIRGRYTWCDWGGECGEFEELEDDDA